MAGKFFKNLGRVCLFAILFDLAVIYAGCSKNSGKSGVEGDGKCKWDSDCKEGLKCVSDQCVKKPAPPATILYFYPALATNSTTATFEFECSKDDCTFTCRLDANEPEECKSPKTYSNLAEGAHTFTLRAIDSSGSGSLKPSIYSWRIYKEGGWRMIAAGSDKTCAVATDGSLWCWGYRVTGSNNIDVSDIPVRIDRANDWAAVSPGYNGACGIKTNGSLWCWGDYVPMTYGRYNFGAGATGAPYQVSALNWSTVSSGYSYTCAILQKKTLYCWRSSEYSPSVYGKYSFDEGTAGMTNIGDSSLWVDVSTGGRHTCGINVDGSILCWGDNTYGQIGNGSTAQVKSPVMVGGNSTWSDVSAGGFHTCGIKNDGSLWCWGSNGNGQLGDGTSIDRATPVQAGNETDWASVQCGSGHTCGTKSDGSLRCWGGNHYGQIGDGTTDDRSAPTKVSGGEWASVTVGDDHTCAADKWGNIWCWGDNRNGQVGDGTYEDGVCDKFVGRLVSLPPDFPKTPPIGR